MADFRIDQAAGLRRLLGGGRHLQVITFVAGSEGVGRSVAVANLGVALARQGKEVMIIDENTPGDDIASAFGLRARFDLLNVVSQEASLAQVFVQPMQGLRVLPASRAVKKLGGLTLTQQRALLDAMSSLERPLDVILVDASMAHPGGFSPFGLLSQEAVVVLSANGASITEAYSLIKKVSLSFARRHFRILVNKVRNLADARSVFENIAHVAAHKGVAKLDLAGAIPLDEALRQAAQVCRPVLLQQPTAPASNALREIASDMLYWQRSESELAGVEQFMQQLLHVSQRITPVAARA